MNSMGDSNFLDVDDFILDSPRLLCSPIGETETDMASYFASLREEQEHFFPNLESYDGNFQQNQQEIFRVDPGFDFPTSDVMFQQPQEHEQLDFGSSAAILEQEQVCCFGVDIDSVISGGTIKQEQELIDEQCSRKRGRSGSIGTKACRERMRREKLNDRFMDLSSVLDPGKPPKTDKPTILDDAIRVLNHLKNETQQLKESNEKLLDEIKCLKEEKNEMREEKLVLKADKEKLKAMVIPSTRFMPTAFQSYGYVPMWQYLNPLTRDTSRDHELRPPAA